MAKLSAERTLRKAISHERNGQMDEARKCYDSILELFPGNIRAKQGLAKLSQPKPGTLAGKNPSDETLNQLIALYNKGQIRTVIQECDRLTKEFPQSFLLWNLLGATNNAQGKPDEAIAAYNKALLIKPDYAEVHNNMGNALRAQGKPDEAIAAYNKALLIKPDSAEAHRNLSALKKYTYSDPHIVQMGKLYTNANISVESRCHLCFALAKSSEDLGNLEEAFRYFKEGNALRIRFLNYDIVQDEELFSRIRKTANSFKNVFFNASGKENFPTPILILGMPRSGTTLVEQIISNHSKVTAADELSFLEMFGSPLAEGKVELSGDKLRTVRNQYLNEIKKLSLGRPFVTDKMPNNFLYISLICSALPEAKIIHVKRNPAATCWSNYKQHFAKGLGYSYDLLDVVHYYQMYEELMLFWDEHYPGKIYHLDYEQLTTDQEPETKKLIQYLGIDWEDACLFPEENKRYVKTASNLQVREKVYKGSSEEWKKFEKYLDRAFDELLN